MKKATLSKYFVLMLLSAILYTPVFSQTTAKKVTTRPLSWNSYFNTLQFSPKWSLTTDVSERFFLDGGKQYQFFLRTMANYSLGQNWSAGAGFGYIRSHTSDPASTSTLAVPELRPFEELSYKQKFNKITLSHRYRIEERYIRKTASDKLIDGYNFNFRFRYQFTFDYNLYTSKGKSQMLNFKAGDEVMVNAGKNIVTNMFDQNRLIVGFNYQPIKDFNVQLDYMYIFQQRSTVPLYNHFDVVRLQVFQRINLSKKHA